MITFFDAEFWGRSSTPEMVKWCTEHPAELWQRVIRSLTAANITDIELTFAPFDAATLIEAYGSAPAAVAALDEAGLRIVSAFYGTTEWTNETDVTAAAEAIVPFAEALRSVGGSIIVSGVPMAAQWTDGKTVDLDIDHLARVLDALAVKAKAAGLDFTAHTESHSVMVTESQIDAVMQATNPDLVGLCPDASHIALSGGDPSAVVRRHADRVLISHWKDAARPFGTTFEILDGESIHDAHGRYMASLGDGIVDLVAWREANLGTPGRDLRLLELDSAADPVAELVAARALVEALD